MSWKYYVASFILKLARFIDDWFYYFIIAGLALTIYNIFFFKDWDKALFNACKEGKIDDVEKALTNLADVNIAHKYDCTALMAAAHKNHHEIVSVLLKIKSCKVDAIDAKGSSALHFASAAGGIDTVKLLLENKADVKLHDHEGNTALHVAIDAGHLEVVRLLLAKKADVKFKNKHFINALHAAIHAHHKEGGRLGIIRLLLRNKSNVESTNAAGWTALTKAAYKGFVHVMELLLESGANVDAATATGFTPLIAAAQNGWKDAVALLLEHGANPLLCLKDGSSALVAASYGGYQEIVDMLSMHHGCLDLVFKNGSTALMTASLRGFIGIVRTLIRSGADVNKRNSEQWTALTIAVQRGFCGIARELLEGGADPDPCTGKGFTPLMLAVRQGRADLVRILLNHKAAVNHFALRDPTDTETQATQLTNPMPANHETTSPLSLPLPDETEFGVEKVEKVEKEGGGEDQREKFFKLKTIPLIYGYIPPLFLAIANARDTDYSVLVGPQNSSAKHAMSSDRADKDDDDVLQLLLTNGADLEINISDFISLAEDPDDMKEGGMTEGAPPGGTQKSPNAGGGGGGCGSSSSAPENGRTRGNCNNNRRQQHLTREQQRREAEEMADKLLEEKEQFEVREQQLREAALVYTYCPTPLLFAVYLNKPNIVRYLLKHHASRRGAGIEERSTTSSKGSFDSNNGVDGVVDGDGDRGSLGFLSDIKEQENVYGDTAVDLALLLNDADMATLLLWEGFPYAPWQDLGWQLACFHCRMLWKLRIISLARFYSCCGSLAVWKLLRGQHEQQQ